MVKYKKDNLSIFLEPNKLTNDAYVCVSFPASVSGCCLKRLMCCDSGCSCFTKDAEETLVCWALYKVAYKVLAGSPNASISYAVTDVKCGSSNKNFFICWQTKNSVSAVRRSITAVLKIVKPSATYSYYSMGVKHLGGKSGREQFAKASNAVKSSLEKSIAIAVIGKVKADQNTLKDIVEHLDAKVNTGESLSGGAAGKDYKDCECNSININVHGWEALCGYLFIGEGLKGANVDLSANGLDVNVSEAKWRNFCDKCKKNKLADVYANKLKAKALDNLGDVLARIAIGQALLCSEDIVKLIDECKDEKKLSSAINACLKC